MQKQANRNPKPNEATHYYPGVIMLDGVRKRVLFTQNEFKRPIERALKQPEEFTGEPKKSSPALGVFSYIVKKILTK